MKRVGGGGVRKKVVGTRACRGEPVERPPVGLVLPQLRFPGFLLLLPSFLRYGPRSLPLLCFLLSPPPSPRPRTPPPVRVCPREALVGPGGTGAKVSGRIETGRGSNSATGTWLSPLPARNFYPFLDPYPWGRVGVSTRVSRGCCRTLVSRLTTDGS